MSRNSRFTGLMGSPDDTTGQKPADPSTAGATTNPAPSPSAAPTPAVTTAPAPAADEPQEKKTRAKVQLNTQQPEDLKNAVDKAAAYLSFTTGKKTTTTDVVEQALRMYLEQLPDAAKN